MPRNGRIKMIGIPNLIEEIKKAKQQARLQHSQLVQD